MCRNFFLGISGGVLTPLTPPLDPPLITMQMHICSLVKPQLYSQIFPRQIFHLTLVEINEDVAVPVYSLY